MPEHVRIPQDWRTRLLIGGLGGLTLVIVRAIQLGFYIDSPPTTALVGWLTLLGLAVISMIVALLTDDHTPLKVYITGLGAPSLVAAFLSGSLVFSSPAETRSTEPPNIPELGLSFLPSLYAQGQPAGVTQGSTTQSQLSIEDVDLGRMQSGSISDGLRASIVGQRPPDRNQHLYVIGRTTNEATARETAEQLIGDIALAYQGRTPPEVHLLRAVGDDDIFISIGSWSTALATETLRSNVMSVFLGTDPELETKSLIREGVVVDARGLAAVR